MQMKNISFLGLGVMGYPMAGHLADQGHQVTVWNRTAKTAEKWFKEQEEKGLDTQVRLAKTVKQAVEAADIVMACVGADKDILELCLSEDGVFKSMPDQSVFIDHTTTSPTCAMQLDDAAKKAGIYFMDAPVSGGEQGAINGKLTVMCGGDQGVFDQTFPILEAYGACIQRMGDAGAGQKTKMVNQICIAGVLQGLSEALFLAQKQGLDEKAVIDVISQGAAQSWQMVNRGKTMVDRQFDFGFAIDWMRKDLAIVKEEAGKLGLDMPLTRLVDGFYEKVQKQGGGRQDTSALIRCYDE